MQSRTTDDTLEPLLKPLDGFLLVDAVSGADFGRSPSPPSDTSAWSGPIITTSAPNSLYITE